MTNKRANEWLSFLFLILYTIPVAAFPQFLIIIIRCGKYMGLAWAILLFFKRNYRSNKMLTPIWILIGVMALSTIINWNGFELFIKISYPIFSCVVIATYYIELKRYQGIIDISVLFSFLLIGQGISILLGGFGTALSNNLKVYTVYFFGPRVEISCILIFAVSLSLISAYKGPIKIKLLSLLCLASGLYFIIKEWVSTAIVTMFVFFIVLIISRILKSAKIWRNLAFFIIALVIGFYFTGANTNIVSGLIENYLQENTTLSGRTYIWEQAIGYMDGWHWWLGNGLDSEYSFSLGRNWNATTAHSQYLNFLFYFGFFGLAAYLYYLIRLFKSFFEIDNYSIRSIVIAACIAFLVLGISTSIFRYAYMYIFYVVVCMLPREVNNEVSSRLKFPFGGRK